MRQRKASLWSEIEHDRIGEFIEVRLVGGLTAPASMIQHGYLTIKMTDLRDAGSKWIVPVGRMVRELGAELIWDRNGLRLVLLSGKVVRVRADRGLSFMFWEDFVPIKEALLESHRKDRQRMTEHR